MRFSPTQARPHMDTNLNRLFTYKTLHALCSTNRKGQMRAHMYVTCLVYGRAPLWGVWLVSTGKFLHFANGRDQISEMHPNLTWRKVMARWQLTDDTDSIAAERRTQLTVELEKPLPGDQSGDKAWNTSMVVAQ
jgi:hypothetical protein